MRNAGRCGGRARVESVSVSDSQEVPLPAQHRLGRDFRSSKHPTRQCTPANIKPSAKNDAKEGNLTDHGPRIVVRGVIDCRGGRWAPELWLDGRISLQGQDE